MHLTIAQTFTPSAIDEYLATLNGLHDITKVDKALLKPMIDLVKFAKARVDKGPLKEQRRLHALFCLLTTDNLIDLVEQQASPIISPVFTLS